MPLARTPTLVLLFVAWASLSACGGGGEETYSHETTRACLERDGYRIQVPPPVWTPRSDSALFAAKSAKGGDEQYAVLFGKDREDGKRLEEEVLSASSDEWAAAFGTLNLEHDDVTEIVQRRGNAVYWSLTGHNSAGAITGCLHE